ncbi:MAG: hypothetical protein KC486_35845, partial [Myxococcales bacterium]|nr:hypothetical protein [Myxococcales bacterium]
ARLLDDRGLGRPSRGALRARRRRAGLVTSLVVGLAAAAAFMITDAARSNQRLLGQLLGAIQRAAQAPPTPAMAPADLAPLAEVAHTLADYTVDGPPWGLRWGLYQGEGLAEPALTRYRDLVAARVIAPVAAAAEESLAQTTRRSQGAARELSRDAYWQTVRSLRLYLALTTIEGEPPATEARDWLSEALAESWAELSGRSADERAAPALSAVLVERDLPALAASGALPPGDKRIVERARRLLRRTSRGRLFVEAMTERGLGGEAIRISTFAPAATWLRNNDRKVRPIFTRHGWAEVDALLDCEGRTARPYLRAAAAIDGRMCGEELGALRREYLAAYVREWNQFLDTMHVAEPEGYDPIRAQIEDMTITGGPSVNALEALFKIVADNAAPPGAGDEPWIRAQVHRAQAAAADRRAAHTGDDAVRLALEPFFRYGRPEASAADGEAQVSPLQAYFSVLMRISGPLDEYARTQDVAHLEQARKHAGDVFTLLSEEHLPQQDAKWRPVLQRLLEPPIRGLLEEVRRGESDQLTQRWCNEVYLPFEAMKICYPFTKDGACNASASEVAELFHPTTGALWQLYDDALAGRFPFEGDRYAVAVQGYGSRLKLNPKVADLLTRAKELGEVLFPGGAAGPTFSFSIQFQPSTTASKLRLLVDGTTFEYNNNHNDAFRPLTWPGEGGPPGAELVASIRGGEQRVRGEGFWGFFKLLETGDVHQEQRFIRVKMRVGEAKDVHFILNPESGLGTPLFGRLRPDAELMDVFRGSRLKVPSALFLGGMRCAAKGPR